MIHRCPNQSVVRITDGSNSKRLDVCARDLQSALILYGDQVKVIDYYNGFTETDVEELKQDTTERKVWQKWT